MTFTGQQAQLTLPDVPANQLAETRQRYWRYPEQAPQAAAYLLSEASRECCRDAYFGVHLFRESGNRLATNAAATVRCLWLDEDEGLFPEEGPEPTAIIHSSSERRHLYWRLTHPVSVEWAVGMNRRLATWAKGDTGKAGLASVLRAPGTANYKRHPAVDMVSGVLTDSGPWEPEVMDQAVPELPKGPPQGDRRCSGSENYDGPEVELEPYLAGVEVLGVLPDGLGRSTPSSVPGSPSTLAVTAQEHA